MIVFVAVMFSHFSSYGAHSNILSFKYCRLLLLILFVSLTNFITQFEKNIINRTGVQVKGTDGVHVVYIYIYFFVLEVVG